LRVSEDEENEGLGASQHGENYTQGTLLVREGNGLRETINA